MNEWTVCRVKFEIKDRVEKMVSKKLGFNESLKIILDDYDKLLSERIVKPDAILTPTNQPEIDKAESKIQEIKQQDSLSASEMDKRVHSPGILDKILNKIYGD